MCINTHVFTPMHLHVVTQVCLLIRLHGYTLMYVYLYRYTSGTVPYMCVRSEDKRPLHV